MIDAAPTKHISIIRFIGSFELKQMSFIQSDNRFILYGLQYIYMYVKRKFTYIHAHKCANCVCVGGGDLTYA